MCTMFKTFEQWFSVIVIFAYTDNSDKFPLNILDCFEKHIGSFVCIKRQFV